MRVFQFDTDPVPAADAAARADAAAHADRDPGAALRRLAEICIEAHGIVAREGPAEMRGPLEALLGRIGRQLGGEAEAEAEQAGR